jgi:hypothetical protein
MIIMTPLWSSGQSSWLQIQRSWFDSQHCQIFLEVVGLEWGIEDQDYGRGGSAALTVTSLYLQKLALTPPTSCSHLVIIVRSRTQATEFVLFVL